MPRRKQSPRRGEGRFSLGRLIGGNNNIESSATHRWRESRVRLLWHAAARFHGKERADVLAVLRRVERAA